MGDDDPGGVGAGFSRPSRITHGTAAVNKSLPKDMDSPKPVLISADISASEITSPRQNVRHKSCQGSRTPVEVRTAGEYAFQQLDAACNQGPLGMRQVRSDPA